MNLKISINDFDEKLSAFISQSHRGISVESMRASLKEIFDTQGVKDSNFALVSLAVRDNGLHVEANNTTSYIDKTAKALQKKEERIIYREKFGTDPQSEEDLKKAKEPAPIFYLNLRGLSELTSVVKIKSLIVNALAEQGFADLAYKPVTSYTHNEIGSPIDLSNITGKPLAEGLAEMIVKGKPEAERTEDARLTESEKAEEDEARLAEKGLEPDSEEDKKKETPKAEPKKETPKQKKTAEVETDPLQAHLDSLRERCYELIDLFTRSHQPPDVRARLTREFGAEILEFITLCLNNGSEKARFYINGAEYLGNTLKCVEEHPEEYANKPRSEILLEHPEDIHDLGGSATENGKNSHHDNHHNQEHHHGTTTHEHTPEDEHAHEEDGHTHEHVEEGLGLDGSIVANVVENLFDGHNKNHDHEHTSNGHQPAAPIDELADVRHLIERWGVEGIETRADWNEFMEMEGNRLLEMESGLSLNKHDN